MDIYGKVRKFAGERSLIPWRYQGQYYDEETDLAYNRFRYYSPDTGMFISQDPISIEGGFNVYAYVHDSNSWIDPLGLTGTYIFTDGTTSYIGKGLESRMGTSMKTQIGSKDLAIKSAHIDFGDNKMGLMVEAELMDRYDAKASADFGNKINSPGKKMIEYAKINDPDLYKKVKKNADALDAKFKGCH